jgi:hypothetical protein
MHLDLASLDWIAIAVCVVTGQIFLTVWFAVIFARPWAREYGVDDPKAHTQAVPGYTYAIGLACVLALTLGLAVLQRGLSITGIGGGLGLGVFVALHLCIATALPGYAFLRRYRAFVLAIGSQAVLVLILSTILAAWS